MANSCFKGRTGRCFKVSYGLQHGADHLRKGKTWIVEVGTICSLVLLLGLLYFPFRKNMFLLPALTIREAHYTVKVEFALKREGEKERKRKTERERKRERNFSSLCC